MGESISVAVKENQVIEIFCCLLHLTGLPRLAAWWNRNRVLILGYHSVTRGSPENSLQIHIRESLFKQHLKYLKQRYHVISLEEYLAARRQGSPLLAYSIVLTFDDGFRNFLTVAAPILLSNSMPATAFIITEHLRYEVSTIRNSEWSSSDDVMSLNWEEVRCLQIQGFDFGSHTCTHPKLDVLNPEQISREFSESLNAITKNLGNRSVALAYPHGIHTTQARVKAKAAGFSCALTCNPGFMGPNSDLYALERTLIGDEGYYTFIIHISGLPRLLRKILSSIGRSLARLFQMAVGLRSGSRG
jgi:peptidoglycan/xylan/chitin deacetylase (PgdA/CDA1 family)